MKYDYSLTLACGHWYGVKLSIATARYRRENLTTLPMEARCAGCKKMKQVVQIHPNQAEQLYEERLRTKEVGAGE